MSRPADSPFAVLGIPPTTDLLQMKRGYFQALQRHPPHSDPEGFRRLRAAYEGLLRPGGLAAAFLGSPVDAEVELVPYRARYDEGLKAAAMAPVLPPAEQLLAALWGLPYADALRLG